MGENGETMNVVDSAMLWLVEQGPAFAVKLLVALLILLVGKVIIGMVGGMVQGALKKGDKFDPILQQLLVNIVSKALWVIVLLVALEQLGVQVGPMIAGLGVAGFIFGFAFQDSLSNFAAGLMILANRPFTVGHFVEMAGHKGVVRELNLMATVMTTGDNCKITIPNKAVWGASIINYSAMETRRVDMTVGIGYGSDIDKAKEVIKGLLDGHALVLKDPAPVIEVVAMADSSVNLVVRPWVKNADYWTVYFAMQKGIKEAFDANDIEIPFPQRVVHMVQA